ncbi:hypothetical protein BSL78_28231 [Apostichopus japonicus]|uniref:TGF-beta family profile domain-containing protein n=1 Tax=Stichopus japonicus TaxID=307972 RepID=A0A2G8JGT0_STIJA|nr:hypothetical protein BSL78_28231 [Apostichopus japonicus]
MIFKYNHDGLKGYVLFFYAETDRGRRNIYEFDISGVLARETVVSAELRLYKLAPRSDRLNDFDNTTLPSMIQVIQWPDAINSTTDDKLLLDQRFVEIEYSGLVSFNVTSAFHEFVAHEGDKIQKAFRVKVRDYFEEKFQTKKVVKFAKDPKHGDRRPLLVLFLQDSAIPVRDIKVPSSSGTHSRKKREVALTREELIKRVRRRTRKDTERVDAEERRKRQSKSKKRRSKSKGTCKLYEFEVDFERVGWETWIIAPTGYAANFCDGYCPYPLDAAFNATNHATVQAMLHEKGIKRRGNLLPNPCCVPHEFASLHVLYLDESNVVLKEFDNMVATSCGCH